MRDDLFALLDPFVESILEPTEESLFEVIAQISTCFDAREEKEQILPTIQRPLTEETYKEMWMLRYQQHLGQISFLELLEKYEEILGIPPRTQ
jgi:hypothetical protein